MTGVSETGAAEPATHDNVFFSCIGRTWCADVGKKAHRWDMSDNRGDSPDLVAIETGLVAGVTAVTILNPAVGALLSVFVPSAKKLASLGANAWARRQERKVAELLQASGLELTVLDDLGFQQKLEDDATLLLSTVDAAVRDDEAGKSWAYGALFRAFNDDRVDVDARVTLLKFVKDCAASDLTKLVYYAQFVAIADRFPSDERLSEQLQSALLAAGFPDESHPHFDLSQAVSRNLFQANSGRVQNILSEYGYYVSSNMISNRVTKELLPLLAPAAFRAGVVDEVTDDAYIEHVVEFFEKPKGLGF